MTTVESLLAKPREQQTLERIREIMAFCETFPDVQRYTTQHHIVYKTTRAFAFIYPQQHQFWADVLRKGVADPHHLLKHNHPVFGHIEIPNDLNLEDVKDLIRRSYNATMAQLTLGAN